MNAQNGFKKTDRASDNLFRFHKTRPTIALLLNNIDNPIHSAQWLGVVRGVKEHNFNLVCFTGSVLHYSKDYNEQANMVYELCDVNRFDGVILWMSNIGSLLDDEELAVFMERFRSLPVVCCERIVAGVPCLLQNDYEGMSQAIEHLIREHKRRKILFIRGPLYHTGAQERYRAYRDVLAKHGIGFDSRLVTEPMSWWDGERAIKQLLDRYPLVAGRDFDALVGTSWSMLLMVMQVFRSYGWYAPGDFSAVGYYDPPETRASQPALTTVRSPIYELGKQAVTLIKEQLAGHEIPLCTYLPTTLVIRESCGCRTPVPVREELALGSLSAVPQAELPSRLVEKLLTQTEYGNEAGSWLVPLFEAFLKDVDAGRENRFFKLLTDTIYRMVDDEFFVSGLQKIIAWLRVGTESLLPENKFSLINRLCDSGLLALTSEAEKLSVKKQIDSERFNSFLHEMEGDVVNICELKDLTDFLITYLPRFDIPACYISLFKEHKPYRYRHAAPQLSTLVFAYRDKKIISSNTKQLIFPSSELVPSGLLPAEEPFTAVVESLYSRKEQIGFVVFQMGPRNGKLYNNLRYLISNAVQQVLLFETEQKAEQALANYTVELARANTDLIRSNKELEFFAYTVSHDLMEPLRMVKSYLELIKKRFNNQLDKKAIEFMGFAVDGADRMERMINDLLAYARLGAQSQPFETFDCRELVQEIVANLTVAVEEHKAVIRYDELPILSAEKKQLGRVFQNLIGNALKFHGINPPVVHIKASHKDGEWEFSVSDNGIGIPPADYERIFMIFQRLHSRHNYAGTGIGLAVCKKIIEQHGGRIWVSSVAGEGSTFYFTLPDKLQPVQSPS